MLKKLVLVYLLLSASSHAYAQQRYLQYAAGSQIAESVVVENSHGKPESLRQLIADQGKSVYVVFIFGGGGMGYSKADKTGGLWCPDSFEDMHILRSLAGRYKDQVGIVPVAVPPVYHAKMMGFPERVFLDAGLDNDTRTAAKTAFLESTEKSFAGGTIPVQPFYDMDFNFLISAEQIELRNENYPAQNWHGAFRAANETQHYGVPNLWLLDADGKVLHEPFRGNIYHPHGTEIVINYTLQDVIDAIVQHIEPET